MLYGPFKFPNVVLEQLPVDELGIALVRAERSVRVHGSERAKVEVRDRERFTESPWMKCIEY